MSLENLLVKISETQGEHGAKLDGIRDDLRVLGRRVDDHEQRLDSLETVHSQAKAVHWFAGAAAGLIASIAAIVAWAKGMFQ